ncbi:MAG: Gfo/Idh/MocA family oxidoreductase [Bacillota bacterium]|nr:Gfo/Idh/MocA family oxidoreductase [Bacillota bacterium]
MSQRIDGQGRPVADDLKIAVIGLGRRSLLLLEHILLPREELHISALCDLLPQRLEAGLDLVEAARGRRPVGYCSYQEMLLTERLDAVLVFSSWENHLPATLFAMEQKVAVACEVGGAYSVHECWQLVDTYERTRTPVMLLENCCYGRTELALLEMVRAGLFGALVHAEGGYLHDLRNTIGYGEQRQHYRRQNYRLRNADSYPTHALGPIAMYFDINRGNRIVSLASQGGGAWGMEDWARRQPDFAAEAGSVRFAQSDIVKTQLGLAGGQTVTLTLDTTLPRPYSRGLRLAGTRAMYNEENHSIFEERKAEHADAHFNWRGQWGNADRYVEQYEHPIWSRFLERGVRGGHGGMDWLVFDAFFDTLVSGEEMPIDACDMATWMAVTALSEESLALGGQPLPFPDFTKGQWLLRRPAVFAAVGSRPSPEAAAAE